MSEHVTHELLKGFLEAFNRHDLDSIMSYFAAGKITRKDSFWKILA